jgi:AhpD family alkylhydroperoxidase
MNTITDKPRLSLPHVTGAAFAAMVRLEERIKLDPTIRLLVQVRASQMNGCAFCLDMHWTEARAAGESEARLAQLDAWAESPFYDERERAALALTEAMTRVAATHVPGDVWAHAARQFDDDELANLVWAIGAINLWNRVQVATRAVPASATEPAAA